MGVNSRTNATPQNPEGTILEGIGSLKEDRPDQPKDKEITPNRDWRDEGKKILTSGLS